MESTAPSLSLSLPREIVRLAPANAHRLVEAHEYSTDKLSARRSRLLDG